jgi:ATP-dependent Clp protease ATP-binding subunit ClpB
MEAGLGQISSKEALEEKVMAEVRGHFRPEFINRLDDIVLFDALSPADLRRIVDVQMSRLRKTLAERDMQLQLTDDAAELLGTLGYDPVYGARPLKRVIRRLIENPLAMNLLQGKFHDGDEILADMDKNNPDQLEFRRTGSTRKSSETEQPESKKLLSNPFGS